MVTGCKCGDRGGAADVVGLGCFVTDEGGYTTVASALALLVSLSLVLSLATAAWVQNRGADVQAAADAAALAGANVVGSYATVATTLDACVLTLGMAGVVTLGAGLVMSAIPGMRAVGARGIEAGRRVMDARKRFAVSSAKGLRALERALPLAIVTRSSAVLRANASQGVSYVGCAIPYPQVSETDFGALEAEVGDEGIASSAEQIQDCADLVEAAQKEVDAARREGWLADCGDEPRNMCERAATLAGLAGQDNPFCASEKDWCFGIALGRARAYYPRRLSQEAPQGPGVGAMNDSACRRVFYEYAAERVRDAVCVEHGDETVELDLPELPANTSEMRETSMYVRACWPCTQEGEGTTLHSSSSCPGARGPMAGMASLAQLEAGSVLKCATCEMDAVDLGKVAAASTSIDNGFEHFWRRVVMASRRYQQACERLAQAKQALQRAAEGGADAFQGALDALSVPRPKLCPPGAWGCVAVVGRGAIEAPRGLSGTLVASVGSAASAAISAATLAPDDPDGGNDVLSRLFETLSADVGEQGVGVLGSLGRLWGTLLHGYGAGAQGLEQAAAHALESVEGTGLGTAASWLRSKVAAIVRDAGFEPADLRLRKPVLTNSQNVLGQSGNTTLADVRALVERLPDSSDPASLAQAFGLSVSDGLGEGLFEVAELPIPGTSLSIPLTLDAGQLLGVMSGG